MENQFTKKRPISKTGQHILKQRYFHEGETTWEQVANRVTDWVMKDSPNIEEFRQLITNTYFVPNSPALVNSGIDGGGLSACFVVDFKDSTEEIIKTKREREARNSGRVLGYNDIQFFGLPDSKISSKIEEMGIKDKIKELIIKYKPIKVFTHNPSDPMPDHNTVNSVVIKAIKELKTRIPLYGFDVWNLYNLKERDRPLYFVDISDTFWTKVKALSMFKTQLHVMLYFLPIVFLRAKFAGRKNHCKYAERFYRLL